MQTLSASRRNSAANNSAPNSPRPSISGSLYSNTVATSNNSRMSSVNEEEDDSSIFESQQKLLNHPKQSLCSDKVKEIRSCSERSDSGFSECSSCYTASSQCVCGHSSFERSTSIVEENGINGVDAESAMAEVLNKRLEEIVETHDSEVSSLDYEEANRTPQSVESPPNQEMPLVTHRKISDIEKRKISLENLMNKPQHIKHEFSLEKLKKNSNFSLLKEKFNSPEKDELAVQESVKLLRPAVSRVSGVQTNKNLASAIDGNFT